MAYGLYVYINFYNEANQYYTVNIYKRDYAGASSERYGCPPAFTLDYGDGASAAFPTVFGSKATVQFWSETQGEFSDFYVADKREFYIELLRKTQRIWRGWIVPEQRNEILEHKAKVQLTFICGLGELKNIKFIDESGDPYTGRKSYIEILSILFSKLETGMLFGTNVNYRPSGLSESVDPFANMYVDVSIYDGLNCREVLDQVAAGCRVMQTWVSGEDSFWLVQSFSAIMTLAQNPPEEDPGVTLKLYFYTEAGVADSSSAQAFDFYIDDTSNYHIKPPGFTNWPAWDHLDFTSVYSKITNLWRDYETYWWSTWSNTPGFAPSPQQLENGEIAIKLSGIEFDDAAGYTGDALYKTFEGIKASSAGMRLRFSYNLVEGATGLPEEAGDFFNWVYYGMYITLDSDSTRRYARLVWDEVDSKIYVVFDVTQAQIDGGNYWGSGISVMHSWSGTAWKPNYTDPVVSGKLNDLVEYEININEIPYDCSLTLLFWPYIYDDGADDYRDDMGFIVHNPTLEFIDEDLLDYPDSTSVRILNNARFIENGEEFELLQGGIPDDPNALNIYKSSITTDTDKDNIVASWESDLSVDTFTYNELMGRVIFSNHRRPALNVDAEVLFSNTLVPAHSIINDPNSSTEYYFTVISASINFEIPAMQVVMVTVLPFDEISAITETEGERESSSTSSGVKSHTHPLLHRPLTLEDGCASELTLDEGQQVLNLDLSAYLKTIDYTPTLQDVTDNGATTTNIISTAGYQVSGTPLYSEHLTDVAALTTGYLPYKAADGLDDSIIQQLLGNEVIQISTYKSTAGLGYNIFVGGGGQSNEGTNNSAFGYASLNANTTGNYNSAFGYYSLRANTTGTANSAFGYYSLRANTTGNYNSAFGYYSLYANTTGNYNSAFGCASLYANTTGNSNSAFGHLSLYANTTGNSNSAFGYYSLRYNTTGSSNSAFGYASLYANTTGTYNSAFGYYSLRYNTTGTANSAFGYNSGRYTQAGANNETSTNSLYFGYDTRSSADGNTNEIVIGHTAIGKGSNTATIGNSSLLETYLTGIRLKAGTATNAPQKKTAGTLLATPEDGAEEYDGTRFYQTPSSATRQTVAWLSDDLAVFASGAATVGQVPMADGSGGVDWGNQFSVSGTQYRVAMFATTSTLGDSILTTNGTDTETLLISTKGMDSIFIGGGGQSNTGEDNCSLGVSALNSVTSGSNNIGIGDAAAYNITEGDGNIAIGSGALFTATMGSGNIAIGDGALFSITTGGDNIGIGDTAGYLLVGGGINEYSTDSIFIGDSTRGGGNGSSATSNEIVIGPTAIGHGSNTSTIGNSSITDNYFTGNLITTGALKLLESSGATYYTILQAGDQSADITYTLPTAAPAANGYALTATTAGVMSWAAITGSQWTTEAEGISYNSAWTTGKNVGIGTNADSSIALKVIPYGIDKGIFVSSASAECIRAVGSSVNPTINIITSSDSAAAINASADSGGICCYLSKQGISGDSNPALKIRTTGNNAYTPVGLEIDQTCTGDFIRCYEDASNMMFHVDIDGRMGIAAAVNASNYITIASVASIDTSGNADFNSLLIGGTTLIDSSGNADFNSLLIGGTTLIDSSGYIKPVSSSDASAPNNSIYYSTDASKLVYKDSGGSVNALY